MAPWPTNVCRSDHYWPPREAAQCATWLKSGHMPRHGWKPWCLCQKGPTSPRAGRRPSSNPIFLPQRSGKGVPLSMAYLVGFPLPRNWCRQHKPGFSSSPRNGAWRHGFGQRFHPGCAHVLDSTFHRQIDEAFAGPVDAIVSTLASEPHRSGLKKGRPHRRLSATRWSLTWTTWKDAFCTEPNPPTKRWSNKFVLSPTNRPVTAPSAATGAWNGLRAQRFGKPNGFDVDDGFDPCPPAPNRACLGARVFGLSRDPKRARSVASHS